MDELVLGNDYAASLINAVGGNIAPDTGEGIDIAVFTNDGARIQNAVAANLHTVTQNSTEFFQPGGMFCVWAMEHHKGTVGLYVGSNGTGAHMCLIAQNAVAYVVEVGDLYLVK